MSLWEMPDLAREADYGIDVEPLSEADRERVWSASSYHEARETLFRREMIPALTVRECVEVLEQLGVPLDQLEVVPVGVERAWRGEIVGQYPPAGAAIGPDTPIRLFVSHPSLSDRLPDGFVASERRTGERELATEEEWEPGVHRERLEVLRREEPPAMRLLRVLEGEIWRSRMEVFGFQSVFEGTMQDAPLAGQLLSWLRGHPEGLRQERLRWLGNNLWVLSRATGPDHLSARLLDGLLAVPVRLSIVPAPAEPLPAEMITPLGGDRCRLGAGAVLGRVLDDRAQQVEIVLGPLAPEQAAQCARSGELREAQRSWGEALLPVSRRWRIRYRVEDRPPYPRLGGDEPPAMLGLTARLGASRAGARRQEIDRP